MVCGWQVPVCLKILLSELVWVHALIGAALQLLPLQLLRSSYPRALTITYYHYNDHDQSRVSPEPELFDHEEQRLQAISADLGHEAGWGLELRVLGGVLGLEVRVFWPVRVQTERCGVRVLPVWC